jgi:hypothetical protein
MFIVIKCYLVCALVLKNQANYFSGTLALSEIIFHAPPEPGLVNTSI